MTCQKCGQPEHPAMDCFAALWGELKRKEIVLSQLYEACKVARDWIKNNAYRNISRSPILMRIELAIEQAEKESDAGT